MKDEKKTALFSAQLSAEDRQKFEEIADHKGTSKAGTLRQWIRGSHHRLTHIPGRK